MMYKDEKMKDTLTGLKGMPNGKTVYLNVQIKNCPKCGESMRKYYIIGGRERWECSNCGHKEKIK